MPDKKLTDNEIIKALECCSTTGGTCKNCPAFVRVDRSKCKEAFIGAVSIINRQKAEVERLKEERENLLKECKKCGRKTLKVISKLQKKIKTAKAEAIKEFAERVYTEIKDAMESNYKAKEERVAKCKKYGIPICPEDGFLMYCDGKNHALSGIDYFIDNLVKEMVGDA